MTYVTCTIHIHDDYVKIKKKMTSASLRLGNEFYTEYPNSWNFGNSKGIGIVRLGKDTKRSTRHGGQAKKIA